MAVNHRRPKLPVQQFIILAICRFAEPVAFTSVFPYLPEMVRTLGVQENEVATWVGITSAVFSISQCATAVPWGALSDRVGRKPIILIGLFLTMIFSIMFGCSTSLPMAIAARVLIGLGNGNVGIIRTMVAELVPERELQPRAFSLMPLVWTIGSIFGPALGGALASPAKKHSGLFGDSKFFKKYPFALPNFAVSIFFIIGVGTGLLFLRETLETKKDSLDYGLVVGQMLTRPCSGRRRKAGKGSQPGSAGERTPLLTDSSSSDQDPEHNSKDNKPAKPEDPVPTWSQILTPQANLILVAYTLLGLQSLAFDAMFPVFLNYPSQSTEDTPEVRLPFKFAQGLGMDSQAIGILYTFNGIVGMLIQFLIFPYTAKRYGVLNCLKVASCALPIIYFLIPFTALFASESARQATAFVLMVAKLAGVVYAFPCLIILLTNSAPNLRVLGTLNGVATSVAAVGRAAGPACIGSIFSFGVKEGYIIIPWAVLAFVCVLSAAPLFWLVEQAGFAKSAEDYDEEDGDEENDNHREQDGWQEGHESASTCPPSPSVGRRAPVETPTSPKAEERRRGFIPALASAAAAAAATAATARDSDSSSLSSSSGASSSSTNS